MDRNSDHKIDGRLNGEQPHEEGRDNLLMRLVYMVILALMLSLASTVLTAVTVIQFIIMLLSKGEPNARLGDFGTDLGIWIAKAARFQVAASEVKPWPWTDLD